MSLFATVAALTWEHFKPERPAYPRQVLTAWHGWLLEHINAGDEWHGPLAWTLGALAPALALALASRLLGGGGGLPGWAFDVLVLYFCLGFKRASYQAASVVKALRAGDVERARRTLTTWRPALLAGADVSALLRQTLEETLRQSLLRLFGVLFWFILLGVAGAALYLLTRLCREHWHGEPAFGGFSARIAAWLDWLPARALAFSFAIVGNFQGAMECWRGQAGTWGDLNEGILLAAGAGALGVQLGGPVELSEGRLARPGLGSEEAPGLDTLDEMVALVWRAALLWVAVLGLLWLGGL